MLVPVQAGENVIQQSQPEEDQDNPVKKTKRCTCLHDSNTKAWTHFQKIDEFKFRSLL